MFLRAGALALALLLASRLLGVVRESAIAAAFGRTALADLAVLTLSLPDWVASVAAAGALGYVLLPAWAGQAPGAVAAMQRRVARAVLAAGMAFAVTLMVSRAPALDLLAGGLPPGLRAEGQAALAWGAAAVPLAMLAALWVTRAQHERDFAGMYGANLVVNAVLIGAVVAAGWTTWPAVPVLGAGLLIAMAARLGWLRLRAPPSPAGPDGVIVTPSPRQWAWATLAASLPLGLPFVARSAASNSGVGALATFNYAWKLVELPQVLAIQLVASLAFPAIAAAVRNGRDAGQAMRQALLLAWTLACAAAAALAVGGRAMAGLLFGWGRMDAAALGEITRWSIAGSWGLLPQALVAVLLTLLAAQRRMGAAVLAYGVVLLTLLVAAAAGLADGFWLMHFLNAGFLVVAVVSVGSAGGARLLPWAGMGPPLAAAVAIAGAGALVQGQPGGDGSVASLAAAVLAAVVTLGTAIVASGELRQALRR